jgi:hypothetical protein
MEEESGNPVDEPAITCLSRSPGQPSRLDISTIQPYIHRPYPPCLETPVLYLRIEQAVLQLSLGKLTGLGGGGAGGE